MKSGGKSPAASVGSKSRPAASVQPNIKPDSESKAKAKKPQAKHPTDRGLIMGVSVAAGGGRDLTEKCKKGIFCDQYVTHHAELMFKMLFAKALFVGIGGGYHSIKDKSETYNLSSITLTGGVHILFSRYFDVMLFGRFGAIVGRQKGNLKTIVGIHGSVGGALCIPYRSRKAIHRFMLGASYDNHRLIDLSRSDTDISSINIFLGFTAMF